MNRFPLGILAGTIALACVSPALAASGKGNMAGGDPSSVQKLIAMKNKLGLTEEQTTRLQAIRAELREKNEPLQQQVDQALGPRPKAEELKGMSKGDKKKMADQRRAAWKQHPELKPVGEQIQANRKAAKEQALAVLTPEQRQMLEKEKKNMKGKRAQAPAPEAYDAAVVADED